jgi:bla regulator protein BlaR1
VNFADLGRTVLQSSGQASVLILCVLAIQTVLSSKIPALWRYALWAPVVLRLLLPMAPESRFSLFNLFNKAPDSVAERRVTVKTIRSLASPQVFQSDLPSEIRSQSISRLPSTEELLTGIWIVVAAGLIVRAIVAYRRFGKALLRSKSCKDERICRILEEARKILGVGKQLAVVEHTAMGSPALFGVMKPRLLLPPELSSRFGDSELRHIFLHELAHVKSGDLYTNWLLIMVQALHWFNPLVWFACGRIRADREFACDVMALDCARESTSAQFGETMVKVLETFRVSRRGFETISVVRDAIELKRRIRMIAAYRPSRHRPFFWCALFSVICLAGLSDAQSQRGQSNIREAPVAKRSSTNNSDASSPGNSSGLEVYAQPFMRNNGGDLKAENGGTTEKSEDGEGSKNERNTASLSMSASGNAFKGKDSPKQTLDNSPQTRAEFIRRRLEPSEFGVPERPDGVVFTASPAPMEQNELYSRTFKLNPETFLEAVRNRIRPEGSIQPASVQDEVREFFAGVGILFAKPAEVKIDRKRKSIFLNEKAGVLLVRATLSDLDVIEEVVRGTPYTTPVFQVKLTVRVAETTAGSKQSGAELIAASAASLSARRLYWKTNVTENSAPIISTVVSDRSWKTLLKTLEGGRVFDLMTTHEFTIQSGNEAVVSISGAASKENKADVRLIATVLGDDMVLTTAFDWTDTGRLAPQGDTFSVNAVGYVTRKIFAATRLSPGQTVILSVPRAFRDGKDLLLFITPQNQGASPK